MTSDHWRHQTSLSAGTIFAHSKLPLTTGGGPASVELPEMTWVNTLIGNVKNAMRGSYHKASGQHLPRYLSEFCYRFNRRFNLPAMLPRLIYAGLRTPPMPYRLLKLAEAHW